MKRKREGLPTLEGLIVFIGAGRRSSDMITVA